MKEFFANHSKILLGVMLLGLFLVIVSRVGIGGSYVGRLEARLDVLAGNYRLKIYGLVGPCKDDYARLLRERYNVKYDVVAGCTVSEWQAAYWSGYNGISEVALERKFHRDVLGKVQKDAMFLCRTRIEAARQKSEDAIKNAE